MFLESWIRLGTTTLALGGRRVVPRWPMHTIWRRIYKHSHSSYPVVGALLLKIFLEKFFNRLDALYGRSEE